MLRNIVCLNYVKEITDSSYTVYPGGKKYIWILKIKIFSIIILQRYYYRTKFACILFKTLCTPSWGQYIIPIGAMLLQAQMT